MIQADVKDLWTRIVRRQVSYEVGGSVTPHGVLMLRITPKI